MVAGRFDKGCVKLRCPGAPCRLQDLGALVVDELHEVNRRVVVGANWINTLCLSQSGLAAFMGEEASAPAAASG